MVHVQLAVELNHRPIMRCVCVRWLNDAAALPCLDSTLCRVTLTKVGECRTIAGRGKNGKRRN